MRPRTEAGQGPFIAGGDPVPMPRRLSYLPLFASVLAFLFALRSAPLFAQEQEEVRRGPRVIYEDKHDTSLPMRTMLLVGPQQGRAPCRFRTGDLDRLERKPLPASSSRAARLCK